MMYQAYQAQSDLMWPLRAMARMSTPMLLDPEISLSRVPALRQAAACKVMELAEVTHHRPPWRIDTVMVASQALPVIEEAVLTTPFATLLCFAKPSAAAQPKVLVVAPTSGTLPPCCATRCRRCCRTKMSTSPIGTTCAMCRWPLAVSGWMSTSST